MAEKWVEQIQATREILWILTMKKILYISCICLLSIAQAACAYSAVKRVYLDHQGNVHEVTANGSDNKVTTSGHILKVKLAKDKDTVAWMLPIRNPVTGEPTGGSNTIVVETGKAHKKLECSPFIRNFWFVDAGEEIAISCGGAHFAGREILYDSRTLKKIDSFDEASTPTKSRPKWSSSGR